MLKFGLLYLSTIFITFSYALNKFQTPKHWTHHVEIFQQWQQHFGKSYTSITEESRRFTIFVNNWRKIHNHNNQPNISYTLGLNQFSDRTSSDFRAFIGSPYKRKPFTIGQPRSNLPISIDWATKGYVTDVKNQMECSSGWAFAAAGAIESRYAIKNGLFYLTPLSTQQLIDCSKPFGNNGCMGGLPQNAYKYVTYAGGLCNATEYPYTGKTDTCLVGCTKQYDPVVSGVGVPPEDEAALQAAVVDGPVAVMIETDQLAFQSYNSGVLTQMCTANPVVQGALVVGYGTDPQYGPYWKLKNSWGKFWGEDGYVRICRNCQKNGSKGQCGILVSPSYPTVG